MKDSEKPYGALIRMAAILSPVASLVNMIAEPIVKRILNGQLKKAGEFRGEIKSLDISFFKMEVDVTELTLEIVEQGEALKFLSVNKVAVVFNFKEMLRGNLVAALHASGISVLIMKDKTRIHERADFNMKLPFLITAFSFEHVTLHYQDETISPHAEFKCDDLSMYGYDFTMSPTFDLMPTRIECRGNICGGALNGNLKLGLAGNSPALDLNLELSNVDMRGLNSLLSAYAKFSVESGELGFYTEVAARNGSFKGYAKPLINNLEIVGGGEHPESIANNLWQGFLTAINEIFKNHKDDQLGTKIPVEGSFSKPDINIWYAVAEVLKNAFVTALKPSIDHTINIDSVEK